MAWLKSSSLEGFLQAKLLLLALPICIFSGLYAWSIGTELQWILITEVFILTVCLWFIALIKRQVLRAFTRASLHVDAIGQEDFNQFSKSAFSEGKVKEFHQQLKQLSETLQSKKSRYDQHVFLVYQLISQLDAPILVFNQKHQLTFANDAFTVLYKQPWQMFRHAPEDLLGLEKVESGWRFKEQDHLKNNKRKWQIRHSDFIDNGETHQLLVFINIESVLRESQHNAWQQIIRVLGHEIRNSLTPVSSMAETLSDKTENERDKMVLNVITERCLHLQTFVERYASLSKQLSLNCQWLSVTHVMEAVTTLFKPFKININNDIDQLWADGQFFEQVLINLIKNAQQAGASKVDINVVSEDQYFIIEVVDDGHGFSNLENLFVPLYTTKNDGQGIGLCFCRNIIEQHQGVIELHNNDEKGVTVMMLLPIPA